MFSSSSFDKNSLGPENSSPGRNNLANRFPVGIPSLSDDNQQIRIQLAVHKYNNTGTSSLNNGRTLISPVRHSFLKNSLKAKTYDGDPETSLKSDRKSGNQYEGVGAFPTIHLKKSSIRYRPIRRFNEVKVPYPELPVNRFLSHLPELCPDLKSSTRSVLDVLQDLSGKKISGKDSEDNKPQSKGLGGDYYLDPNAAYKPLFVQRPKINSVLTKDNTTQTLPSHSADSGSSQCGSSIEKTNSPDPRAELRRRLARQNNEIFASLSSSISSSFAVKRKIDKVLPAKDGASTEGSAVKKSKISENQINSHVENGILKSNKKEKTNPNDSVKLSRRSRLNESTTTSPNKDRLTTIFLDLQNTSPKSQVFQMNSPTTGEKDQQAVRMPSSGANGVTNKVNGSSEETSTPEANALKTSAGSNLTGSEKLETEKNKISFNLPTNNVVLSTAATSTTATDGAKSNDGPTFQFGFNGTSSGFSFPKTSIANGSLGGGLTSTGTSTTTTTTTATTVTATATVTGNGEKNDENNKPETKQTFTFGALNDKPNFGSFKFGVDGSSQKSPTTSAPAAVPISTAAIPQFSFGTKSNGVAEAATTATTASGFQFGQTITSSAQNFFTSPVKPLLTFGQSSTPNKNEEKTETPKSVTTSLGQGVQSPGMFSFGQKPAAEVQTTKNEEKPGSDTGQNTVTTSTAASSIFTQSSTSTTQSFNTQSISLLQNPTGLKSGGSSLFAFGQKPEVSTAPTVTTSAVSKAQPAFSFTFGKTDAAQTKPPEGVFGQKPSTNLFSFGQKSSESTPASETSQPNSENLLKPQPTSNPPLMFGQNVSQASSIPQTQNFATSGQTATTNAFGAKSETVTFGQMSTPAFGQTTTFSSKGPLFGSTTTSQPVSVFGTSTTTQPSTGFGTSTSSVGFGATTTQSTPAFGAPISSQSAGFGASAPTAQTGAAFGAPSSTPSTIGFGDGTAASTAGFGSSGFATAPATQSGFGVPAATPSTTGFAMSASSQSFSQPFNNKPTSSIGQTPGIFGSTTINQNPLSNTGFGSTAQNSIFGQKTSADGGVFGQGNKVQTPAFGQNPTSQSFGTPFGMSTANTTGFTTSPPNTTAASVFNFGGGSAVSAPAQSSTFSFGNSSSGANNTQLPFAFKGAANDTFKFGASTAKEGTGFGGGNAFGFGGQMNAPMGEAKPPGGVFSFGNNQPPSAASSASGFSFGTTPSPSVFSFGGSGSSASSGSSFNFGTPQPGTPFGQSAIPSQQPFPVPGMFSMGSGGSQSRPRASSRLRRRP